MKSLHTRNEKESKVRSKLKLNYKHFNNKSSLCSRECLTKHIKSETRKYHRPYPIYQRCADDIGSDPVLNLVKRKQAYQLKMETIKYMYHKYQKTFQVDKQFQSYNTMQDILAQEPDKYFASNYNWYYTGGNLTMQKIGNIELMFHTINNSELCVAKIRKKCSGWRFNKKPVLCNLNSESYQLDSINNGFKTLVGVRQKNDILLCDVKINDNEDVACELANIQRSDVPFVSMCLDTQSHKEYAVVNAKQFLQVWDLFSLKPVCEYQVPHDLNALEGDCFAQVTYCDNNSLAYINRTNYYIFDKRCISTQVKLDKDDILECPDRFVNICPHQNNPSQHYISTYCDVLVFDVRINKVVNKYSHGFTSAPYISDLARVPNNSNSSIFCISSSKPDEKLIFEQNESTYCIPVSLPTLTDSFDASLLSGSNMDMSLSIRQGLNVSTTGMHLWSSDDDTSAVFSANVLGNIYCHEMAKGKAEDNNTEHLHKWSNTIEDDCKGANQLNYADKVVLHGVQFSSHSEPLEFTSIIKNKRLQDSTQDLKKSKKGFCAKICDLWEDVGESNVLDNIEEIPADVTVRNWLSQFCPDQEQPDS